MYQLLHKTKMDNLINNSRIRGKSWIKNKKYVK